MLQDLQKHDKSILFKEPYQKASDSEYLIETIPVSFSLINNFLNSQDSIQSVNSSHRQKENPMYQSVQVQALRDAKELDDCRKTQSAFENYQKKKQMIFKQVHNRVGSDGHLQE